VREFSVGQNDGRLEILCLNCTLCVLLYLEWS